MSPQEFYLIWEARRPRTDGDYRGHLSKSDLEELYQLINED